MIPGLTVFTTSGQGVLSANAGLRMSDYFSAGDAVQVNGSWYCILTFTGVSALVTPNVTVTASAAAVYKIHPIWLETDLDVREPKSTFNPYSKPLNLVSALVRGGGWKMAEWRWGFITQAQRETLRDYIDIPSSDDYLIRTKIYDDSDKFYWFTATAMWPFDEDRQTGRRVTFTVKFQAMVQITC